MLQLFLAMRPNQLWLGVIVLLILALGSFWYLKMSPNPTSQTPSTPPAPVVKNQVVIQKNSFTPLSLTVKVGETVTWVNEESYAHNVVGDGGLFTSPKLATGEKFSFTFTKAGTFTYICSIHPFMHATIIVTP